MKVYTGQTRGGEMLAINREFGWGEMTVRGQLRTRKREPWAYDNGAYTDWKRQRPFDWRQFEDDIGDIRAADCKPDFIVCPDIVAGGKKSLDVSLAWAPDLYGIAPLYLAVQDGMAPDDVAPSLDLLAGIFVGGTNPWKIETGAEWVAFAHRHGRRAHIGRAGTENKATWALWAGADSLDSCFPLWTMERARSFMRTIGGDPAQPAFDNGWGRRVASEMTRATLPRWG